MTLLWFIVMPFELYLYIKVNKAVAMCEASQEKK